MNNFKLFSINLGLCMICIILFFVITSLIFANTSISDTNLDYCVYGSVSIPVFIYSLLLNKKVKKRGIMIGMFFGISVMMILSIISLILYSSVNFSLYTLIYLIVTILTGMLGGIIGVNI